MLRKKIKHSVLTVTCHGCASITSWDDITMKLFHVIESNLICPNAKTKDGDALESRMYNVSVTCHTVHLLHSWFVLISIASGGATTGSNV